MTIFPRVVDGNLSEVEQLLKRFPFHTHTSYLDQAFLGWIKN